MKRSITTDLSTDSKHPPPSKLRKVTAFSSAFSSASTPELALWKASTTLPICDGVTAIWSQTKDACSIKITVRGQETKLGRYGDHGNQYSRVESGYLSIGNTATTNSGDHKPPLFLRRFASGVIPEKASTGYLCLKNLGTLELTFKKKSPGNTIDAMFDSKMDSRALDEYNNILLKAKQIPNAMKAFLLQQHLNHILILRVLMTNKASYADVQMTTNGGSVFLLEARIGGVHISEVDIVSMLKNDQRNHYSFTLDLLNNGNTDAMGDFTTLVSSCKLLNEGDDLTVRIDGYDIDTSCYPAWTEKRKKDGSLPQMGVAEYDGDESTLDDGKWLADQCDY